MYAASYTTAVHADGFDLRTSIERVRRPRGVNIPVHTAVPLVLRGYIDLGSTCRVGGTVCVCVF